MSEIITFYSYKGGVGRTMALANVSVMLSRWGHKVLVVDWDLEAPGLEHFYKEYVDIKAVATKNGVVDLLQLNEQNKWQDCLIEINIPPADVPVHLISSGKRDEDYFKKVRSFDVDEFYKNKGGAVIEQLRNEWLANYDYVLIDSRTGITEIGGICTIQLPDTVVMLFTATNQGFEGVLDIMQRASAAQQKLSYDRQKLVFLPIPSKFETNTEFKLSQEWLDTFAERLEVAYNDWLPVTVNRKDFLELTKIPYIAYFSFGEKLPVIEQGVKDPSGLGYAYETLAALIANRLDNVDALISNREQYVAGINKNPSLEMEVRKNGNGSKLRLLKQKLNVKEEIVSVEKSKEVIIGCIENSVFPFLRYISQEIKKIGTLFKSINETVEIVGKYHRYKNSADGFVSDSMKESTSIIKTADVIRHRYSQNTFEFRDFQLNTLIYSCNLKNLRKSNNNQTELPFKIIIEFHESVFEVRSDDGSFFFDKLYSEIISPEESESIADTLSSILLEKIEAATKQ